jgi:hypothetical protein
VPIDLHAGGKSESGGEGGGDVAHGGTPFGAGAPSDESRAGIKPRQPPGAAGTCTAQRTAPLGSMSGGAGRPASTRIWSSGIASAGSPQQKAWTRRRPCTGSSRRGIATGRPPDPPHPVRPPADEPERRVDHLEVDRRTILAVAHRHAAEEGDGRAAAHARSDEVAIGAVASVRPPRSASGRR